VNRPAVILHTPRATFGECQIGFHRVMQNARVLYSDTFVQSVTLQQQHSELPTVEG